MDGFCMLLRVPSIYCIDAFLVCSAISYCAHHNIILTSFYYAID